MAKREKLSALQERFCLLYVLYSPMRGAARKAAREAGCTTRSADSTASDWLKTPKIQARIAELQKNVLEALEKRTLITKERIEQELALVGFQNPEDYYIIGNEGEIQLKTFEEMPEGAARAIAGIEETRRIMGAGKGDGAEIILEIKHRYRHHDKIGALQELNKMRGYHAKQQVELLGDYEAWLKTMKALQAQAGGKKG